MKILICDDDLMFAQAVHDRLLEFCSRNGISASVIVHSSAENIPPELLPKFDIAFLDIDMKPTDGFTLARNIHNAQPNTIIIFLTNYPQFAAEGYEVQAFRYLLKTKLDQKLIPYFQAAVEQFRSIRKTVSFTLSGEETDIPVRDVYKRQHVYNLKTHRGGLWLWCSACKQFFHSSVYVPTWWSNLPIVDENQLSAFPQYLDALSTRIDKHINQLISNKKHLVLPAK